jgi:hypothetical protein
MQVSPPLTPGIGWRPRGSDGEIGHRHRHGYASQHFAAVGYRPAHGDPLGAGDAPLSAAMLE